MRRNPHLFRLTAGVALTAILCDALVPAVALAQPAPPPLPQPYQAQPTQTQGDPPARVGRIARLSGTVSFRNQGDTQWSEASVNYPVSAGNAFWTEPGAEAQLEIAGNQIALAPTSELDIATLDDTGLQAVAAQGEAFVHLRDLGPNEAWSVQTPRGLVRLQGEGRYEIAVGNTEQPTRVTVVDGTAAVEGQGVSLRVGPGQTATITGTDVFQGSIGPALRSPFLTARLDAERPRTATAAPVPASVSAMPGGSDLSAYGNWGQAPDYGEVWYPPVASTWVPYREGHWAYVSPWGWTWIDDAPWGFAPFHYGRWVEIGGRWAWPPGGYASAGPPVYAPALVTFIGIGAGVALGAALASGSIGWVPLGPREPFHPWYRASSRYVRDINIHHVTNVTNVTVNNAINRGAATAVPAAAMAGSRPIQSFARPISGQEFATARPITGQQPIRPAPTTAGVTPSVARQLNLGPATAIHAAPGPTVRPSAPGPAINGFARPGFQGQPGATGTLGQAGARQGSPPGVTNAASPIIQPGQPNIVGPGGPASGPAGIRPMPPENGSAQPTIVHQGAPQAIPGMAPQPGQPAQPNIVHSAAPSTAGVVRPMPQTMPGAASPTVQPFHPNSLPSAAPPTAGVVRPMPQAIRPAEPAPGISSAPRPVPQSVAPPRPEPPHMAPQVPRSVTPAPVMPHVEQPHFAPPQQHFAPPPAAPHMEPQHFAPPAPRQEAPHPAPAPAREKRPGER